MADNYLCFSFELPDLSDEEAAWLREQLQVVYDADGQLQVYDDDRPLPAGKRAAWRFLWDHPCFLDEELAYGYFDYEFDSQSLWLYSDEFGEPYAAGILVQKFLNAYRPKERVAFCWATYCSKPRINEFGGGAVLVTADEIKTVSTFDIAEDFLSANSSSVDQQ